MKKRTIIQLLSFVLVSAGVSAATVKEPYSPSHGILCDRSVCADSQGISMTLTRKYLGKVKSEKLAAQGDFDHSAFTFFGGTFCDTKEKLCRKDRYYGPDGKHSGKIDKHFTRILFGH